MSKHTPGPWKVGKRAKNTVFSGEQAIEDAIADVFPSVFHQAANLDLIAAAPEILDALKACRAELVQNMSTNEPGGSMDTALKKAIELADNAIAKAEGRSK